MRTLAGPGVGLILFVMFFGMLDVSVAAEEKNSATNGPTAKGQNPFDMSMSSGSGPINIRSKKLEFFYNEKRIVYHDDVVATRDKGTLKSDLLTVTYEEQVANNSPGTPTTVSSSDTATPENSVARRQRIKEAVAEGNVEITSESGNATCKKAIYNELKRTVILNGDAVLRNDTSIVKGEVVTVYLDENRVTVEGNADTRPEMEITPKQNEKGKKEAKVR